MVDYAQFKGKGHFGPQGDFLLKSNGRGMKKGVGM
jgi:hypothetical protein